MQVARQFRSPEPSGERGVTMVLVALAMIAIIAMAAMSIDLITLYLAREEAQRSADAAALAAARIISVSGITGAGNPSGSNAANWRAICGSASGWATQAANAAAAQNSVGGQAGTVLSLSYSDGAGSSIDCSTLSAKFAVNPMVTVQVQRTGLANFFSRIWGSAGNSISATATAEAFNPSASDVNGVVASTSVTPVQPQCVKPWIVPNLDPGRPLLGDPFVTNADGAIGNPGIAPGGLLSSPGVIGESFTLYADCYSAAGPCALSPAPAQNPPGANAPGYLQSINLQYLPGAAPDTVAAVPSCAAGGSNYEMAVAGCDQTTVYQCGLQAPIGGNPNSIDLRENPSGPAGDTALGLACSLTHTATVPLNGQDQLRTNGTPPYPFVALAGTSNPLGITADTPITSSASIVSLPIYDQTANGDTISPIGTTNVNIVGFLQVFVNQVYSDGGVNVTVLNVAGCGSNTSTNPPVFGNSPVPVRLITPHKPS